MIDDATPSAPSYDFDAGNEKLELKCLSHLRNRSVAYLFGETIACQLTGYALRNQPVRSVTVDEKILKSMISDVTTCLQIEIQPMGTVTFMGNLIYGADGLGTHCRIDLGHGAINSFDVLNARFCPAWSWPWESWRLTGKST